MTHFFLLREDNNLQRGCDGKKRHFSHSQYYRQAKGNLISCSGGVGLLKNEIFCSLKQWKIYKLF